MKTMYRAVWCLLGALALLATACSTDSPVVSSQSDNTVVPLAQADEPTAVPTDEPTAVPAEEPTAVPAEPTAVPATEVPEPEPTAIPEDDPKPDAGTQDVDAASARGVLGTSSFGDDLTADELTCAISALADDLDLLSRTSDAADVTDMSLDDQADLAIIAFDCAPEALAAEFSQALSAGAGDDITFPPSVGECFAASMSSGAPDRREVILGFAALGAETAVPVDAQGPVVDTMVECIPGEVFAGAVSAIALEDPALGDALDISCLTEGLDGEALRPMWQAMVSTPDVDFDDLSPEEVGPLFDAMFTCISFGQFMAADAEIDLSPDSIACIDDSLFGPDIFAMMETGEGADEMTRAVRACLSPEELQQLSEA